MVGKRAGRPLNEVEPLPRDQWIHPLAEVGVAEDYGGWVRIELIGAAQGDLRHGTSLRITPERAEGVVAELQHVLGRLKMKGGTYERLRGQDDPQAPAAPREERGEA